MHTPHTNGTGWRYGLLGLPLAFVSLPLYVTLPRHYAEQYAMPLGTLGILLLATRLLDAVLDPRIGHWVDQRFERAPATAWWAALFASCVMALGFAALWAPPASIRPHSVGLLAWLACALICTYVAYSIVSMVHQTWGARWGGQADQRARLVAWREGVALAGVLLASILPIYLGLPATSWVLILSLVIGLWTLHQTLPAHIVPLQPVMARSLNAAEPRPRSPWSTPPFVALMMVFLLNGTASAMPATLLPFFVRDTLQTPSWEPLFLGSYFLAAAFGLPLWVQLIKRLGLAHSWLCGMGLSILAFSAVPLLGPGDALAFEAICLLTGLTLGADLAIPGALLTGVVHHAGWGQQGEGRFFGWWTAATKLNLALASGLTLPLLALVGFETGRHTSTNQTALALTYGLLPCGFKLMATWTLWRGIQRHPVLKGQA